MRKALPVPLLLLALCMQHGSLTAATEELENYRVANMHILKGDLLRIKCDALPFKSFFSAADNACFYVIEGATQDYDSANEQCRTIITASQHQSRPRSQLSVKRALSLCRSRGMWLATPHHDSESQEAVALVPTSEDGIWLGRKAGTSAWADDDKSTADYFRWSAGAQKGVSCESKDSILLGTENNGGCTAFSYWRSVPNTETHGSVCWRPADSPFGEVQKPAELPVDETTPITTTTTTTIVQTTTTTTQKAIPAFQVTRVNAMQLWTYYNYATISHAPANPGGWFQNYLAGKGYHMSSGINHEGWVIQSAHLEKARAGCNDGSALHILRIRWENGKQWIARVGAADGNDVGVVSQREGACGANRPIWTWSCAVSPDWHYTNSIAVMEANTWYRGRRWSANPEFWTWNL